MPLTCAEELISEPNASCSAADLEQNRLVIALLEEHNARRTWRNTKQDKAPVGLETRSDRKIIVGFSGGSNLSCQPEHIGTMNTVADAVDVVAITAATAGIMLDTSEQ